MMLTFLTWYAISCPSNSICLHTVLSLSHPHHSRAILPQPGRSQKEWIMPLYHYNHEWCENEGEFKFQCKGWGGSSKSLRKCRFLRDKDSWEQVLTIVNLYTSQLYCVMRYKLKSKFKEHFLVVCLLALFCVVIYAIHFNYYM